MQQHEDEHIRQLLIKNREAGFELLVRTHLPNLYGRAIKKLGNKEDAQEAVQQIWTNAYASLRGFTNERILTLKVENWLNTIETHIFVDIYTKRAHELSTVSLQRDILGENPTLTLPLVDTFDVEQMHIERELHEQLLQAITLLPKKPREVVSLYYIQHYKEAEIAKMLHIPESTVKSHIRRSKPVLLRELRKHV